MKKKKAKPLILSIRRPIPPTGGPIRSEKQKQKEKRLKGKRLIKQFEKDYLV